MNVAGLDLSTKRVGYAAPDGTLHSITPHAGADDPYRRLAELRDRTERAIRLNPPLPDLIVIEDYSLGGPGIIGKIRLGEVGGVVRTRLYELGIRFVLVRPASLKRFATGNGNADKPAMVARAIALGARPSVNDDEADAFHARRMGLYAHGVYETMTDYEADAVANTGIEW